MKFVQSSSGKEVALAYVNSLSLSWVPSHLYFSGVAGGRIKSKNDYNGQGILITTPSHLIIYNKKGEEIWNQPLETVTTEEEGLELRGIDLIRFTFDNKEIDFGTGLQSRKKLVTHLSEAKKQSVNADDINQKLSLAAAANNNAKKQAGNNAVVKAGMSNEEAELKKIQIELDEANRIKPGKLVVEDHFHKIVRIYENGYVQVSGVFAGKSAPFEKLLGISSNHDHIGGDGSLTIVTDQKTHALYLDGLLMDLKRIKSLHKLTTAGQAVLDSARSRPMASANQSQANSETQKSISAADEIAKLVALRDAGALTDNEFQILKKKYL